MFDWLKMRDPHDFGMFAIGVLVGVAPPAAPTTDEDDTV